MQVNRVDLTPVLWSARVNRCEDISECVYTVYVYFNHKYVSESVVIQKINQSSLSQLLSSFIRHT